MQAVDPAESTLRAVAKFRSGHLADYVHAPYATVDQRVRAVLAAEDITDHDVARELLLPLLSTGLPPVQVAAITALKRHWDTAARLAVQTLLQSGGITTAVRLAAEAALERKT